MTEELAQPRTPEQTPSDEDVGHRREPASFPIVGLGASAGGLAALQRFLGNLPEHPGMAFVVIQHLSPEVESDLPSILSRSTSLPVEAVSEATPVEVDHVYVIQPNTSLELRNGVLFPERPSDERRYPTSIDSFFTSLANDLGEDAIGIVLSGTGSDGSRGVEAIKERHGLVFAQSPEDADSPGMPESAIETGMVDVVSPADVLASRLVSYSNDSSEKELDEESLEPDEDEVFDELLKVLLNRSGHDFSGYKRPTLLRRIGRRMSLHRKPTMQAYLEYLKRTPNESDLLFHELLIEVTDFFRDKEVFDALADTIIPAIVDEKESGEEIRVWVPGCASGQEAYSLAMLLRHELDTREVFHPVKIFATDIDPFIIENARRGHFTRQQVENIPEDFRERYFEPAGAGLDIRKDVREMILFAVHDVLQDPPFARLDLASCRNVLIYLGRPAQERVFGILHYALGPAGYLVLGASESADSASDRFSKVDAHSSIYRTRPAPTANVPGGHMRGSAVSSAATKRSRLPAHHGDNADVDSLHLELLADEFAPPSLLINRDYDVEHISGDTRRFLGLPAGKPTKNVLKMVAPEMRLELRKALIDVFEQKSESSVGPISMNLDGTDVEVLLNLRVVRSGDGEPLVQILFQAEGLPSPRYPAKGHAPVSDDSAESIIASLERELERTQERLRTLVDEYETSNEELTATNEELLTMNEELQSTTEELETSKEELQATNEELSTVNQELNANLAERDELNSDLNNFLAATNIGTIFLDDELRIRRFTAPVTDYFNLIDSDVGRPIEHITHQLDYEMLGQDALDALDGLQSSERRVEADTGKTYIVRIRPYRTTDDRIEGVVITFFDDTELRRAQEIVTDSELLFRTVFESASDAMYVLHMTDSGLSKIAEANVSACTRLGYGPSQITKLALEDIVEPGSVDLEGFVHTLREEREAVAEWRSVSRDAEVLPVEARARLFSVSEVPTVLIVSRDISGRKRYEQALMNAKQESERLAELHAAFLANMSHEIRTPLTTILGLAQLLGDDLPEKQANMVRIIRSSGKRLHNTLNSVLDLSRLEAGQMKPAPEAISLADEIGEIVTIFRPIAERRGLTIALDLPDDDRDFWTDPEMLSRIVTNLVDNAIKFTKEGRVSIHVDREDEELTMRISDTGIGIDPEFLPHLFDKFEQASRGLARTHEGSGLGMALVKLVVELLDGTIDVESTQGKGTTFTIRLPDIQP